MEKKGRLTAKIIILDSLLFIFLLLNIWVVLATYLGDDETIFYLLLTLPPLLILCILFFTLGKRDMSDIDKLLASTPTAAFIGVMFSGSDVVLLFVTIVGALSCPALVILTVRKVVSKRSRVSQ